MSQEEVIKFIERDPDKIYRSYQIAESLGTSKANCSRACLKLYKAGFLIRIPTHHKKWYSYKLVKNNKGF